MNKTKEKKKIQINKISKNHKVIITFVITMLLAFLCYNAFNLILAQETKLIQVPVATHKISSGTMITEEDIRYIEVPQHILIQPIYKEETSLIGQFVDNYNSIAEGSLFYKDLIVSEQTYHNANLFNLKENENAISIDVDIKSSYANSVHPGHMIDLYYLGKARSNYSIDSQIIYGKLVSSARVIAVKDSKGKNISESTEATAVIVVALVQEDAHLIEVSKALGSVIPIISYDNLNQEAGTNDYYDMDKLKNIILGNSFDVTLISNEEQ